MNHQPFFLEIQLQYRAGSIDVLLAGSRVFFAREDIERALQYTDRRSLNKMKRSYPDEFLHYVEKGLVYEKVDYGAPEPMEASRQDHVPDGYDLCRRANGVFALDTVIAICSHVQRFRAPATFLKFLRTELSDIEEVRAALDLELVDDSDALYNKSEREMLIQIGLSLVRIEKMIKDLAERREGSGE